MTSKTLGVGIIGTGWVAGAHIDNFQGVPNCEIRGVTSRQKARAEAKIAAHDLHRATAYSDLEAMLARDDIDIVVLCTPHPNHPDETVAAARAGKHIVIEKPVALERSELQRMLGAVRKAGVLTSVCFELRWIGLFKNIKALVKKGVIGRPFYGESAYFHGCGPWYPQYPWNRKKSMGRDAFMTAGCHALDGLIWLMGSEVIEVSAMSNTSGRNPLKYEYDPNVTVIMRFANGAIGKVATSIECRQPYLFPVLLQGDRGSIWNDRVSSLEWPGLPGDSWAQIPGALPDSGDVNDHPYLGQLTYFVECIRKARRPHNDLESCAHVHEVMFSIEEALKTRRHVKVKRPNSRVTVWE